MHLVRYVSRVFVLGLALPGSILPAVSQTHNREQVTGSYVISS
jgi:hypothetical protein